MARFVKCYTNIHLSIYYTVYTTYCLSTPLKECLGRDALSCTPVPALGPTPWRTDASSQLTIVSPHTRSSRTFQDMGTCAAVLCTTACPCQGHLCTYMIPAFPFPIPLYLANPLNIGNYCTHARTHARTNAHYSSTIRMKGKKCSEADRNGRCLGVAVNIST